MASCRCDTDRLAAHERSDRIVATLVCFHAHPDDESIATGGLMAKASAAGHRVVLVVATRGELGEPKPGVLAEGEQLGMRRINETFDSAKVLGVHRVEFLGYVDSGMVGTEGNSHPYSFCMAEVDTAANRLAAILREESPDALTIYDHHGGYGHPDHIQVHRVGLRAAEMVGLDAVFEATMNRDDLVRTFAQQRSMLSPDEHAELPDFEDASDFGMPEAAITHAIDVAEFAEQKRASMRCHRSQIGEDDFFLKMDDSAFARAFGVEWFIAHGSLRGDGDPFLVDLFA